MNEKLSFEELTIRVEQGFLPQEQAGDLDSLLSMEEVRHLNFENRIKKLKLYDDVNQVIKFLLAVAREVNTDAQANVQKELILSLTEAENRDMEEENDQLFSQLVRQRLVTLLNKESRFTLRSLLHNLQVDSLDAGLYKQFLQKITQHFFDEVQQFDISAVKETIKAAREFFTKLHQVQQIKQDYEQWIEEKTKDDPYQRPISAEEMPQVSLGISIEKSVLKKISELCLKYSRLNQEIAFSCIIQLPKKEHCLVTEILDDISIGTENDSVLTEADEYRPGEIVVHLHTEHYSNFFQHISPGDILKVIDDPAFVDPNEETERIYQRIFGVVSVKMEGRWRPQQKVVLQLYIIDFRAIKRQLEEKTLHARNFGVQKFGPAFELTGK